MLMRIIWGKVRPGLWSEFEDQFHRSADPRSDGLLGYWLARNTNEGDSNSFYTVALFRDAGALSAWESLPARSERTRTLRKYLIGEYSVSVCEVSYAFNAPLPLTIPAAEAR